MLVPELAVAKRVVFDFLMDLIESLLLNHEEGTLTKSALILLNNKERSKLNYFLKRFGKSPCFNFYGLNKLSRISLSAMNALAVFSDKTIEKSQLYQVTAIYNLPNKLIHVLSSTDITLPDKKVEDLTVGDILKLYRELDKEDKNNGSGYPCRVKDYAINTGID